MKYLDKSFSSRPSNEAYRSNWDAVFGPKKEKAPAEERTEPEKDGEGKGG